jgi:hypothetical protein
MMAEALMDEVDWPSFSYSLADVLVHLSDDETFSMQKDDGQVDEFGEPDALRYVQVCAYGSGWLRCEVVSNRFLPPDHQHSLEHEEMLRAAGWNEPSDDEEASPNWYVDIESAWVDFAADMIGAVFRDVWGVTRVSQIVGDEHDVRRFRWRELPDDLR